MTPGEATKLVNSLFEWWYSSLLRYTCRLIGDMSLAEDVVQESFMQLYMALVRGNEIREPKAWTFTVVRREVKKRFRARYHGAGRHESLDILDTLPVRYVSVQPAGLEYDEVTRLLSVLTAREEEVLLLRLEALKYRDIGKRLGISISSVNTLLARALRKLQAAVTGSETQLRETAGQTGRDAAKSLQ